MLVLNLSLSENSHDHLSSFSRKKSDMSDSVDLSMENHEMLSLAVFLDILMGKF